MQNHGHLLPLQMLQSRTVLTHVVIENCRGNNAVIRTCRSRQMQCTAAAKWKCSWCAASRRCWMLSMTASGPQHGTPSSRVAACVALDACLHVTCCDTSMLADGALCLTISILQAQQHTSHSMHISQVCWETRMARYKWQVCLHAPVAMELTCTDVPARRAVCMSNCAEVKT